MRKNIVAVSGGVDSVVLLDMLSKTGLDLVVAHFDHGIRENSEDDARFVEGLSKRYGLPFETKREELGPNTSEGLARTRRYEFLRSLSEKHGARLITAHHLDDVVETIAINLSRGTGWRGLAAMDSDIYRPLTHMTKEEVIKYATRHDLKWREDSTNLSSDYLRNRIRSQTMKLSLDEKLQILSLWSAQKELRREIDKEVEKLINKDTSFSRYFFINQDKPTSLELIRGVTKARLTRPQMEKVLHAIKTARSGKVFEAGSGVKLRFTPRNFTVEMIK